MSFEGANDADHTQRTDKQNRHHDGNDSRHHDQDTGGRVDQDRVKTREMLVNEAQACGDGEQECGFTERFQDAPFVCVKDHRADVQPDACGAERVHDSSCCPVASTAVLP
jgi:hypothetical protein